MGLSESYRHRSLRACPPSVRSHVYRDVYRQGFTAGYDEAYGAGYGNYRRGW